jgi:hypothetical protein
MDISLVEESISYADEKCIALGNVINHADCQPSIGAAISYGCFSKSVNEKLYRSQVQDWQEEWMKQFMYSISSHGVFRIWILNADNRSWTLVLQISLQEAVQSMLKVVNGWLDYYYGNVMSVVWVTVSESNEQSIFQADLTLDITQKGHSHRPRMLQSSLSSSYQDFLSFKLGPIRKIFTSAMSKSDSWPFVNYREKTVWIIGSHQSHYQITVISLSTSQITTILIDCISKNSKAQKASIANFVDFYDTSVDQSFLRGLRSDGNAIEWSLNYQLLKTDSSLHFVSYNIIIGKWTVSEVELPSDSTWIDRCTCNHTQIASKLRKQFRRKEIQHFWNSAKLLILCHSSRDVYVSIFLPLLHHLFVARIANSGVPASQKLYLEVLATNIFVPNIDATFYRFEASSSLPPVHELQELVASSSSDSELAFTLKSMRPWRVVDEKTVRLPLFLFASHKNTSLMALEICWNKQQLDSVHQGSLYHSDLLDSFGFLSEIFAFVFAVVPSWTEGTKLHKEDRVDALSTSIPPVEMYDHLLFLRNIESFRMQNRNSEEENQLTLNTDFRRQVHCGQALYDLMQIAGIIESKLVAGREYYRFSSTSSTFSSDQEAHRPTWIKLLEEASSWIPLNYQEFVQIKSSEVRYFAQQHHLLEAEECGIRCAFEAILDIEPCLEDIIAFKDNSEVSIDQYNGENSEFVKLHWPLNWLAMLDIWTLNAPPSSVFEQSLANSASIPSSTIDLLASLLSPEVFLQLLSSCHSYPAVRLIFPALWQQPSSAHSNPVNAESSRLETIAHPVPALIQLLLELCPQYLCTVVEALLQAHERLLLHDLQILYGEQASSVYEDARNGSFEALDSNDHHHAVEDQDDNASFMFSVASEEIESRDRTNSRIISSTAYFHRNVAWSEETPLKELGWGHIFNFGFQPAKSLGGTIPNTLLSNSNVFDDDLACSSGSVDNGQEEEEEEEEEEEDRSPGNRDLDGLRSSSKERKGSFDSEDCSKMERDDEGSVYVHHRADHQKLLRLLRRGVLAAFSRHFSTTAIGDPTPALPTMHLASLSSLQQDSLLRVLVHCKQYVDVARLLVKMCRFSQLYSLTMRLCLVSNLHDHVTIQREDIFDPELGAHRVVFRRLHVTKTATWQAYREQSLQQQDTRAKALEVLWPLDGANCEERDDFWNEYCEGDVHQFPLDEKCLLEKDIDHDHELLQSNIVLSINSLLQKPPLTLDVQRAVERALPPSQHQRKQQAEQVFGIALRVLFALLYGENIRFAMNQKEKCIVKYRIVELLRRQSIQMMPSNLLSIVDDSLPNINLAGMEQHRQEWLKFVDQLSA